VRALASYILRGRMQAVGVTSLLSLLSLLMPPLAYLLSGVPVALVALRQGPVAAIQIMFGSMLLVMAFLIIVGMTPLLGLSLVLGVWLPVVFCAVYLRRSASQAMLLLAAGIVAAGYAGIIRLVVGDVAEWWGEQLMPQLERALAEPVDPQTLELLESLLPYINGIVAAGLAFSLVSSVLIARWLQAMLFNPGGFGQEFRAISLPRVVVAVAAVCLFSALLLDGEFAGLLRDWVFVMVVLFLFQGLSLCHAHVRERGWKAHWLWALYLLLLFFPQTMLFIACLGFADAWLRGSQPRLIEGDNDNGSGPGS
jgi:hypothetical protein